MKIRIKIIIKSNSDDINNSNLHCIRNFIFFNSFFIKFERLVFRETPSGKYTRTVLENLK